MYDNAKFFGQWSKAILVLIATTGFVSMAIEGVYWAWHKTLISLKGDDIQKGEKLLKEYIKILSNSADSGLSSPKSRLHSLSSLKSSLEPILSYMISNWHYMIAIFVLINIVVLLYIQKNENYVQSSIPKVVIFGKDKRRKTKNSKQKLKKKIKLINE